MPTDYMERRMAPRVDMRFEVKFKVLGEEAEAVRPDYSRAEARNLSRTGLCIFLDRRAEEGSVIRIELAVNNGERLVKSFCEVEWIRTITGGYEAGLSFIALKEEDAVYLSNIIKTHPEIN